MPPEAVMEIVPSPVLWQEVFTVVAVNTTASGLVTVTDDCAGQPLESVTLTVCGPTAHVDDDAVTASPSTCSNKVSLF